MATLNQLYLQNDEIEKLFGKIDNAFQNNRFDEMPLERHKELIAYIEIAIDKSRNLIITLEFEAKKRPEKLTEPILALIPEHKMKINEYTAMLRKIRFRSMKNAFSGEDLTVYRATLEGEIHRQVIEETMSLEKNTEIISKSNKYSEMFEQFDCDDSTYLLNEDLERSHKYDDVSKSTALIKLFKIGIIHNKSLHIAMIFIETVTLVGLIFWKFNT